MFTWICPKCGSEVPPAYSECPNCAKPPASAGAPAPVQGQWSAGTTSHAAAPLSAAAPPPPAPAFTAPPPPISVPPAVAVQPPPAAPPEASPAWATVHHAPVTKSRGIPSWATAVAAMAVVAVVLAGIYFLVPRARGTAAAAPGAQPPAAQPATTAPAVSGLTNTLELTGFRVNEDRNQRVQVRFLVVNHSLAELPETKLQVTLKSDRTEIMSFPFALPSLGPHESREITATTKTRLRTYEMPDWQFIKAEIQDVPEAQSRR